jgi:hypothetical protein
LAVVKWYNLRSEGLGRDFIEELNRLLLFISENPKTAIGSGNKSRITRMKKFPYLVEYYLLADEIRVINVIHVARNPELRKGNARKRKV